jgi:hypothetical protein
MRGSQETMAILLTGDFNVNVKDNYNVKLVEFMKNIFELDVLSKLSKGTSRSNSCIDMVFGLNVNNLSYINYVSSFSYHRRILNITNPQTPQLTDVVTKEKKTLGALI